MIQITPHMRILLAVEPVDFRKGIDGLGAVCRQLLALDPMSGVLVVFCNRSRGALKLLVYDGQGFWVAQKRLSQGRFAWWPRSDSGSANNQNVSVPLDAHQLQLLLWNGNPEHAQAAPMWRALKNTG